MYAQTPLGFNPLPLLCSSWNLQRLNDAVQKHLDQGFAGLCTFLQSLTPEIRLTSRQIRGILLHTRLWCCAGAGPAASHPCALNSNNVLRALGVVPIRVIGDNEQGGLNSGMDFNATLSTKTTQLRIPPNTKTKVVRARDTTTVR